jgi:hypothetical protein
MAGAGPRPDIGLVRGALRVGLLWVVGLGGGDLRKKINHSLAIDTFCLNQSLQKFYKFLTAF